jgi:hypothetical protein
VWLSIEEAQTMADALKMPLEEFARKYTRRVGDRLSLKEHAKSYDCVFLEGKRCSVYEARPKQCRTFPWWNENVNSVASWKEAAARCEGINHPDAPLVSLEEIEKQLL